MSSITDWIMVIITAVYVLATIAICIFNYKSAKASQIQVKESIRQYNDSNKPHIVAGIKIESEIFMCLYIKNIGNDVADNIRVDINPAWLALITEPEYLVPISELTSITFMLAPSQEIIRAFTYVIVGVGNTWLDKYNDTPLKVSVSYLKHNSSENYSDEFYYDIKLFRNMFREKEEHEKEIKEISKSLKALATSSDKMALSAKSIDGKIKK